MTLVRNFTGLAVALLLLASCSSSNPELDEVAEHKSAALNAFYNTGTFEAYCSNVGSSVNTRDEASLQEAGFCMGYVAGLIDYEAVAVLTSQKKAAFCVPANLDLGKLVVRLNEMLAATQRSTGTASHWVALALAHLFPSVEGVCPAVTAVADADADEQQQ
ncbi:MAG: hypothetical protein JJ921_10610 [Pseudomonadales bacterium]|nr:hypothetical protein [Pseudomonadales bacterium]MBO7006572.1 hypothetical protein [Pseudomonadales bacterium]